MLASNRTPRTRVWSVRYEIITKMLYHRIRIRMAKSSKKWRKTICILCYLVFRFHRITIRSTIIYVCTLESITYTYTRIILILMSGSICCETYSTPPNNGDNNSKLKENCRFLAQCRCNNASNMPFSHTLQRAKPYTYLCTPGYRASFSHTLFLWVRLPSPSLLIFTSCYIFFTWNANACVLCVWSMHSKYKRYCVCAR